MRCFEQAAAAFRGRSQMICGARPHVMYNTYCGAHFGDRACLNFRPGCPAGCLYSDLTGPGVVYSSTCVRGRRDPFVEDKCSFCASPDCGFFNPARSLDCPAAGPQGSKSSPPGLFVPRALLGSHSEIAGSLAPNCRCDRARAPQSCRRELARRFSRNFLCWRKWLLTSLLNVALQCARESIAGRKGPRRVRYEMLSPKFACEERNALLGLRIRAQHFVSSLQSGMVERGLA